ncbi:conserved hypothetical protein [Ramlibacter tataouinensis TTB310]|uniref:Uncharacterized protein n=1 Tax=Ramlibacter tataouinensis (strain ATCC BAA-407 / DSM 14655 / LMG 21543 / TTB310) TaxID=365046 RepID=F5Y6K0_RAMTT|nr:conserved hypothetical protein [Ramlibacter tataouinensis TTB310]
MPPLSTARDPRPAGRALPPPGMQQVLFSELLRQRRPAPAAQADATTGQVGEAAQEPPPTNAEPAPQRERPPAGRAPARSRPHDDPPPAPEPAAAVQDAALHPDEPWRRMARDVAATIAAFCNEPAVANSEGWQVQMELRPDVVADTTLCVTLSPHWLTLRFHARDASAHDLLFRGQQELADILKALLVRNRDVAISFEPK